MIQLKMVLKKMRDDLTDIIDIDFNDALKLMIKNKNMIVNVYDVDGLNTGKLKQTNEIITIKPRRWIDKKGTSHPMKYVSPVAFENKNVYFLHLFGNDSKLPHFGKHISLTFWQNQLFLLMQKSHWLQKEENIRYIINILFLIGGVTIGILNYLK